jgi:hypothetical protein
MKTRQARRADGRTVTVIEREWEDMTPDERTTQLQRQLAALETEVAKLKKSKNPA